MNVKALASTSNKIQQNGMTSRRRGIKTKGLRYALTLAAFFNALGTVVRYVGDLLFPDPATKLAFQFIGQCMTAAAQPTV